jgi:glycosyltransferase involved in cell wall biosynthesis
VTGRVSVVIPCFNYGRFLGAAIESVLAQTYPEIEVIVVDDGSTDDTRSVAAAYKGVRYVWQPNRGLSDARNRGIALATGEFMLFLDADDQLSLDGIETSIRLLRACSECAFVYGHQQLTDESGAPIAVDAEERAWYQTCLHEDPYAYMLRTNFPLRGQGAILYRADIIKRIGGFARELRTTQDLDLNFRIVREHPICCNDSIVALTRRHDSMSRSDFAGMLRDAVRAQRRQRPHVRRHPVYESDYKAGLKLAREYWGGKLSRRVLAHAQQGEFAPAIRDLWPLVRFAPAVAAATVARFIRGGRDRAAAGRWRK